MTQEAALQAFFGSFGVPAYSASAVPHDVIFPYLTYTPVTGLFGEEAAITVDLWFYTTEETAPNAMARELSARLGLGGVVLPCDGGAIWLTRGLPFSQSLRDDTDPCIKRRYINISAQFLTNEVQI